MILLIVLAVSVSFPFYLVLPFYPFLNMESTLGVRINTYEIWGNILLMTVYQAWMLGELIWLFYTHEKKVKVANKAVRDSFRRLIGKTLAQALFRYVAVSSSGVLWSARLGWRLSTSPQKLKAVCIVLIQCLPVGPGLQCAGDQSGVEPHDPSGKSPRPLPP